MAAWVLYVKLVLLLILSRRQTGSVENQYFSRKPH